MKTIEDSWTIFIETIYPLQLTSFVRDKRFTSHSLLSWPTAKLSPDWRQPFQTYSGVRINSNDLIWSYSIVSLNNTSPTICHKGGILFKKNKHFPYNVSMNKQPNTYSCKKAAQIGLFQGQVVLLVPDDSLQRFCVTEKFSVKQNEAFFTWDE